MHRGVTPLGVLCFFLHFISLLLYLFLFLSSFYLFVFPFFSFFLVFLVIYLFVLSLFLVHFCSLVYYVSTNWFPNFFVYFLFFLLFLGLFLTVILLNFESSYICIFSILFLLFPPTSNLFPHSMLNPRYLPACFLFIFRAYPSPNDIACRQVRHPRNRCVNSLEPRSRPSTFSWRIATAAKPAGYRV